MGFWVLLLVLLGFWKLAVFKGIKCFLGLFCFVLLALLNSSTSVPFQPVTPDLP